MTVVVSNLVGSSYGRCFHDVARTQFVIQPLKVVARGQTSSSTLSIGWAELACLRGWSLLSSFFLRSVPVYWYQGVARGQTSSSPGARGPSLSSFWCHERYGCHFTRISDFGFLLLKAMRFRFLFASSVSLLLKGAVQSKTDCPSTSFCEQGVSLPLFADTCSEFFNICDDGDETTESRCLSTKICSHKSKPDAPVQCFSTCKPSCEGKECGEDECGGFCGQCPSGQGCFQYACVTGSGSGSCKSPFFLGNLDSAPTIDTDSRVTIVTTGDTTQSLHVETPSCNTLTASPELIYQFFVPAGHVYG